MSEKPSTVHSILERLRRWADGYNAEVIANDDGTEEVVAVPRQHPTRYMALVRRCQSIRSGWNAIGWQPQAGDAYELCPSWFKTLLNARRRALGTDQSFGAHVTDEQTGKKTGVEKPPGLILVLDPEQLPAIDPSDIYPGADKDEYQFAERMIFRWSERATGPASQERAYAERQVELWTTRAERLRSKQ